MHGPDIQWYVILSAILFTTGALGVMLRRNPLIILLSVEIMLNSANLLLIAFSRLHGREDGQIFAISVMAVAAAGALMVEIVIVIGLKASGRLAEAPDIGASFGSPAEIGKLFLTDHLLAFEITSIVLLAAAVGGVVLGSQASAPDPEEPSSSLLQGDVPIR